MVHMAHPARTSQRAGVPAPARYPAGVLTAAVLAAEEVSFLLVGSAALWLRGEQIPVRDADAVIEPDRANLGRLRAALSSLAVRPRSVPSAARLHELSVASVDTSYGHLDCLLERGRQDWQRLQRNAEMIMVTDVGVLVASAADARALRRRFKR
jgi:hypothetical protein